MADSKPRAHKSPLKLLKNPRDASRPLLNAIVNIYFHKQKKNNYCYNLKIKTSVFNISDFFNCIFKTNAEGLQSYALIRQSEWLDACYAGKLKQVHKSVSVN